MWSNMFSLTAQQWCAGVMEEYEVSPFLSTTWSHVKKQIFEYSISIRRICPEGRSIRLTLNSPVSTTNFILN